MTTDRTRRLAAIWFADIAGFTSLAGRDEDAALAVVDELQALAPSIVDAYGGRIVKFVGDGALAIFESTDAATRAALALQAAFKESEIVHRHGSGLRIAVHVGEVVEAPDGDVYGDGVNVASRLQSVAEVGGVVASASAAQHLENRSDFVTRDAGSHELKGVRRPVQIFRVVTPAEEEDTTPERRSPGRATMEGFVQALAGRYRIESEIGRGGMATVYEARDLQQDRPVAVKVIDPQVANAVAAQRFLREIKVTANLMHPNILPLHDSGEAGGLLYYVMPLVEGESLAQRLRKKGALPVDEALRIATDCAEALEHAHSRGIIHRDVKPGNILLSGRRAILADFGISRAFEEASDEEALTKTGVSLGTVGYMSPEQAGAERNLDARTDTYALGCVLYEMLAGEPAFHGPTAQAIMARQVTEAPPSVSIVRPSVPGTTEAVILKALAKNPADRFQTATEFREALAGGGRDPGSSLPQDERAGWVGRTLRNLRRWLGGSSFLACCV